MNSKHLLSTILGAVGMSQAKAAEKIGVQAQVLSHKLSRDSLRVSDFLKIMEAIGVDVTFTVKDTGKVIVLHPPGHGTRVKGVVDGVKYDTSSATPLANSFFADGENEYDESGEAQELYVDDEGRYFFALYEKANPEKGRIQLAPAGIASIFIEKYGKQKKE